MKYIPVILITGMTIISSPLAAQSKNEMPFSSSSTEANQLLRDAWVAYGDAKFDEAGNLVRAALEKDPEFGIAHAFIYENEEALREQNLKAASAGKLSPDEKLLLEGLVAHLAGKPVADYFEPLLKKYPDDYYLHLWIMFNNRDVKRSTEIGEMIIKRNPKFAPAYNMLGYGYMEQGDLKNAEASFNKYLSLRPDLANAYDSKADYLMRVRKTEEAIALFEKAGEMGMSVSIGRAQLAKAKLKYPGPSDQDKLEIKNIINALSAAYLKSDVNGILEHYADQSLEVLPNQMTNAGIGNIRVRLEGPFKHGSFTRLHRTVQLIEGAGPIAVVWCKTESSYKRASDGKVNEEERSDIFLFRKQESGQWKILVHHFFDPGNDVSGQPSEDMSDIRQVIDKWSFFIKPGEILSEEHVENLANIHSDQGVDIRSDQRSNIGMANLRLLWNGFIGIKWAQFTDYSFNVNSIATISHEGFAQKAVAWGIGDHSNYWNGTDAYAQFLFPWAMILTKEKDGKWRILVYHFYVG